MGRELKRQELKNVVINNKMTWHDHLHGEDNRRLQVLQNQLCRLLIKGQGNYYKYKQDQSTKELLEKCGELSIHQLGAQRTIVMVKKIITSKKPVYLAEKFQRRSSADSTLLPLSSSLNISRSSFMYRGILFNLLPENLRNEEKIGKFKNGLKTWIKEYICVKP